MENNYEFRARHWQVHRPGLRRADRVPTADEVLLTEEWCLGGDAGEVTEKALADFQDYLWVSQTLSVGRAATAGHHTLWMTVDATLDRGFALDVSETAVTVRLAADSEAFRAVVYLEDTFGLEGAPVLPRGTTVRRPLFESRSIHSGCGIDEYPDEELRATVHAGYDAICIMLKDFDLTTAGPCDVNDVIRRAKSFGIQTYIYNYMATFVHPDDPKAPAMFDAVYGEIFRRYPDCAGIKLTGESLEFPSRDPHTSGKVFSESVTDGIPDPRPSPGWYPCEDYPAYLQGIERAVHAVKPEASIVYSTYNWGYAPEELRDGFLKRFPSGYELSVCYEIFSKRTLEGLPTPVMDYTISADTPGEYFETECANAHKYGIAINGNVNTAGVAWDFGCVPYVPAPHKLLNRMRRLRRANKEWGVHTQYATHHYGWWNCVASDLGKWSFWEDFEPDYEELLGKIAVRDYGKTGAPHALAAWKLWSEAMEHYVASNEDQYGPWRVGAAYPMIFHPNLSRSFQEKEIIFPTSPYAHFKGNAIIKTFYRPYENSDQAPASLRYPAELRALDRMLRLWDAGLKETEALRDSAEGRRLWALGQFIRCSIQTVIHMKQWWQLNMQLQQAESTAVGLDLVAQLEAMTDAEEANVRAALPAVQEDSRLGWEPSMQYVCDPWHLNWKLRQLDACRAELKGYRHLLELTAQSLKEYNR